MLNLAGGARRRRCWLIDSILLFALTAYLIWPLFRVEYMDAWASIESTFIGDARMLRDRGLTAEWQPNWYLGTRWDYVYPPALRFGTAALSKWLGVSTARSYHLYTATFYCLGIVGVYWLVRVASGSRVWAWIAALSAAIHSPTFLFIDHFRNGYQPMRFMPLRLGVLIRWGEGPHMSAFALLSFALAASWVGLRCGQTAAFVLAGVLSALVVSNNFYGAAALAIFFPLLVWVVAVAERDWRVFARAAGIAALAYGLTASWLTPSYLRVTLENMRLVAEPGNTWSLALDVALMAVFAVATWWLVRGRPERAWMAFVLGSCARIALWTLGHHFIGFRVIGEPQRLCPEFDLFFILACVALFAWMWRRAILTQRMVVIGLIWLSILPVKGWVRRSWQFFPPPRTHESRVEYQLTKWLHENVPNERAFVAGSVRFWFNTWFDLAEVSGGSDQGTLNPASSIAFYQIAASEDRESVLRWLKATGTGAVVVNYPHSTEIYHDFAYPRVFETLPLLHDNQRGDRIFGVPRKYPGLARIVNTERHNAAGPATATLEDRDAVTRYVESIEDHSPRPAKWRRLGPEAMEIEATLEPGESLVIQETFDEGWHAEAGGRAVPIVPDLFRFMRLDPGPGTHRVLLTYRTPDEKRKGRALTALAAGVAAFLLAREYQRRRRLA